MSTRLPIAGSDTNAYMCLNNYFNTFNGINENIDIVANGNNPPTIKQYTRFQYYKTDNSYTIPAVATGNNEYAQGETPTYLLNEAIYEDGADITFTFGGTVRGITITSISDGTWFIYCQGSYDLDNTTKGQGKYQVTKNAPTYDYVKGGFWHATDGKAIGRFTVASSAVSDVTTITNDNINIGLYQGKGVYADTSIKIYPYKINCNGVTFYNVAGLTIQAISGLSASTWYATVMNENTGVISVVAAGSGWTNWTISGNQLNLMSIYNTKLNYCRDLRSGVYYRILSVFKTNGTPNGVDYIFNIVNRPKSRIFFQRAGGTQTLTTANSTKVLFDAVAYDLNSECDTSNNRITFVNPKTFVFSFIAHVTAAGWTAGERLQAIIYKNAASVAVVGSIYAQATYNGYLAVSVTEFFNSFNSGDYLEIYLNQNSGGDGTLQDDTSFIELTEI